MISKKLYQRLLRALNFLAPYLAQGKLRLRFIILHAPSFKTKKRVLVPSPVEEPPPLVARQEEPLTTNTHLVSSSRCHFLYRRISFRMGLSLPPRSLRLRTLVTRGQTPAHQHLRMLRSPEEPANLATSRPILIRSDSTVVVSLINQQGSNKSKSLTKAVHSLLLHCETHQWHLTSHHIPGHLNSWADSHSRGSPHQS